MEHRHGHFIWYELHSNAPEAAADFYGALLGWKVRAAAPDDEMQYHELLAGEASIAGLLPLTDEMREGGACPVWLSYISVDDVDHTVAQALGAGGGLLMPAQDIPGVGRFALLTDPQGAFFYVMRGEEAVGESVSFTPGVLGHGDWNELNTPEPEVAVAFYGDLFGWRNDETMQMGELGDYRFIDRQDSRGTTRLGAISPLPPNFGPPRWRTYFRVADARAAAETARERGAQILVEPYRVPSGDLIVIGLDPEGAEFAIAAPGD